MWRMFATGRTELLDFQALLQLLLVLERTVVWLLTSGTLQFDEIFLRHKAKKLIAEV